MPRKPWILSAPRRPWSSVRVNKLDAVQIVLKFEDEKYEIVLPDVAAQPSRVHRPARNGLTAPCGVPVPTDAAGNPMLSG